VFTIQFIANNPACFWIKALHVIIRAIVSNINDFLG